jgi:diketogulonate reductase-like aldo/keto reductase
MFRRLTAMPFSETWGGMEAVLSLGLAKAIGVSNFSCALVMDLLKTCKGVARSKLSA